MERETQVHSQSVTGAKGKEWLPQLLMRRLQGHGMNAELYFEGCRGAELTVLLEMEGSREGDGHLVWSHAAIVIKWPALHIQQPVSCL